MWICIIYTATIISKGQSSRLQPSKSPNPIVRCVPWPSESTQYCPSCIKLPDGRRTVHVPRNSQHAQHVHRVVLGCH